MIVVPKPNPLNLNRLGHHAHGHTQYGQTQSTMAPAANAASTRHAHNNKPVSNRSPALPSTPPRTPNKQGHFHSNSRSKFNMSPPSSIIPPYSYSPSSNYRFPSNNNKRHRHANSGFAASPFNGNTNQFPFVAPGTGMTFSAMGDAGPELEMALDLSDMSPPASPSPSSVQSHSRTPSPMSGFSTPSPFTPNGVYTGSPKNVVHVFASSFPSTPAPGPMFIPSSSTRPYHARAPSAPIIPHTHTHSYSFEHDRYANSGWQNSPPPASLPKPKFLDEDMFA